MANCLYLRDSYITKFDFENYAFSKLVVAWLYLLGNGYVLASLCVILSLSRVVSRAQNYNASLAQLSRMEFPIVINCNRTSYQVLYTGHLDVFQMSLCTTQYSCHFTDEFVQAYYHRF